MVKVKSLSEKRLIVEGLVNGKKAYFLLDTGASVGMYDENKAKRYGLSRGRAFNGKLVGGGGAMETSYMSNTPASIHERMVSQFVLGDLSGIVESIRQQTGKEIIGIISLPQMKMAHISLDLDDNEIIFE